MLTDVPESGWYRLEARWDGAHLDALPDLPAEARAHAERPDGFVVDIRPDGAWVVATSTTGFTYGGLALVDLIGTDGQAPRLTVGDSPEIPLRAVVHMMRPKQHPFELAEYQAFLRRVVARGRYSLLFLHVGGAVRLESAPELAHKRSLDPEELRLILGEARALGAHHTAIFTDRGVTPVVWSDMLVEG